MKAQAFQPYSLLVFFLSTSFISPFVLQFGLQVRSGITSSLSAASEDHSHSDTSFTHHQQPQPVDNNLLQDSSSQVYSSNTNSNDSTEATASSQRSCEFLNLEPLHSTPTRLNRLETERRTASLYISPGTNEYWDLRDEIQQLRKDFQLAKTILTRRSSSSSTGQGIQALEIMLRRAQAKDPAYVYDVTSAAARVAQRMGRIEEAERYKRESLKAKKMLPQFNLEGLWVGKYGSHGFEMINVTYAGDRLIAYKVTGDRNVPRGQVTFTANLSPPNSPMDPILLSDASSKKWGTSRLLRYPGSGHASEPGYLHPQIMEGQLILIGGRGEYFSFAWLPLQRQIFFGRPSPELALKMLREGGATILKTDKRGERGRMSSLDEGDVSEMTRYVQQCLDVTVDTLWDERCEGKMDEFSGIWHGNEEYSYFE